MCIMLSDHEPEATKLIHLPVYLKLGGKWIKYNLCIKFGFFQRIIRFGIKENFGAL